MPNFIGSFLAPHALEKRGATQDRLVSHRIVGHARELGEALLAQRRIGLFEAPLVRDRLLLHILDVERPPAPLVVVEIGALAREELRRVDCLGNARVEAEAADRVIHVRRIAAQEHAPAAELLRDALVHVVEVEMQVVAAFHRHMDAPEARAHRDIGERLFIALVLARIENGAPAALQVVARDLEEVGPFVRIGHVVAVAAAKRRGKIERRRDYQEALGPGEALELDAEVLPDGAAAAVAADDVVGAQLAGGRLQRHAPRILSQAVDARRHAHRRIAHGSQAGEAHVGELMLLGLHDERIRGLAAQSVEVELRDQAKAGPVPELENRRHQPLRDVLVDQAELGQDLERRRLRGRGARAVVHPLLRLEQRHAMTQARTCERGDRADRSGADDHDFARGHGGGDYTEAMQEAFRLGAKAAARLIERGQLGAETLIASCHERIAEREPTVKAWAYLARELPTPKDSPAPLRGVPVGVKDIFDTHDMPTAYGSPIYAGYRPRGDAAVVALTRRAGGTILGKTVTAEFATFVPRQTRHPLDPSRTPGGSSSGSAAAVADFMVPLAFATQTAGSLIRPASYCGIFGYKPTFNSIARGGMKPGGDSLDTIGVYGRSVEDVAFFGAALTQRAELEQAMDRAPRIGLCRTNEWDLVQPDMRKAFEDAGRTIDAREFALPASFKGLRESHSAILWYEIARSLADEFERFPDQLDPALRKRCADGFALDPAQYVRAQHHAAQCRAQFAQALGDYDVLIAPAATSEAPKGLSSTGDVAMNVVWTLLHTPAVAVPAGRSPGGMPLGIQVIGRIGDDARTLACARWIAERLA